MDAREKMQRPNTRMTRALSYFLLTGICVIQSTHLWAIDPSSNLPIEIESNRASLNEADGISVYEGDVVIRQGSTRMEADIIEVAVENQRIKRIDAKGSPAHYTQTLEGDEQATHAYGETMTYIAETTVLTMQGQAKFVQGQNSFEGSTIEYDLRARAITASGDAGGDQKVRIQYQPQNAEPVPTTKPPASSSEINENTQSQ